MPEREAVQPQGMLQVERNTSPLPGSASRPAEPPWVTSC